MSFVLCCWKSFSEQNEIHNVYILTKLQNDLFNQTQQKIENQKNTHARHTQLTHACTGPALLLCTLSALLAVAPAPLAAYCIHRCLLLLLLKVTLFIIF